MQLRQHAYMRLRQRCSLNPQDIQTILDKRQYCPIGLRGKQQHELFYSIPDDECFVLVHDLETDEILTILPTNYHNAWPIDKHAILLAKQAILGKHYKEPSPYLPGLLPPDPQHNTPIVHRKAHLLGLAATTTITETRLVRRLADDLKSTKFQTYTSNKSKTKKLIDLPKADLPALEYPSDWPINKDNLIQAYNTCPGFTTQLNALADKEATKINMDPKDISSISISIYDTNDTVNLKRNTIPVI